MCALVCLLCCYLMSVVLLVFFVVVVSAVKFHSLLLCAFILIRLCVCMRVCVVCACERERERKGLINECKQDTKVYFESESLQNPTLYDVFEGVFFYGGKRG